MGAWCLAHPWLTVGLVVLVVLTVDNIVVNVLRARLLARSDKE